MEIGVKFSSLTLWTQEQVQDWRSLNDKYKTRYCRTFFLFLPDVYVLTSTQCDRL